MKRVVFLFPGQGAQTVGMGADFYQEFASVRDLFEQAGDILGRDIGKVAFLGPEDDLMTTRNSQVAIYCVSLALLKVLQEETGVEPIACAGLSLGEYSAVTASKRISFQTCLPLVNARAVAMNAACEATDGTMAAIIGLDNSIVEQMVAESGLSSDLWVANLNCPGQVVLSGTRKGIDIGIAKAKELGARKAIPLDVHGAFHSGLMIEAQKTLEPVIEATEFEGSDIELVMNVTGGYARSIAAVKRNLVEQVTGSVRWVDTIQQLEEMSPDLYIEIGPGRVLAGLNKRIGVQTPTLNLCQIDQLDKILEAVSGVHV